MVSSGSSPDHMHMLESCPPVCPLQSGDFIFDMDSLAQLLESP